MNPNIEYDYNDIALNRLPRELLNDLNNRICTMRFEPTTIVSIETNTDLLDFPNAEDRTPPFNRLLMEAGFFSRKTGYWKLTVDQNVSYFYASLLLQWYGFEPANPPQYPYADFFFALCPDESDTTADEFVIAGTVVPIALGDLNYTKLPPRVVAKINSKTTPSKITQLLLEEFLTAKPDNRWEIARMDSMRRRKEYQKQEIRRNVRNHTKPKLQMRGSQYRQFLEEQAKINRN